MFDSLENFADFSLYLRLRRTTEIIDSHPEPDVFMAVLFPKVVGELLEACGIGY